MKTPKKKMSSGQKTIEQQLRFTMRKFKRSRTESLRSRKREKEIDDAEHKERRIQRRLEEERRILEMQMEPKKKEEREKEEKRKEYSLLNDCKFSKTKLSKLVITKFDVIVTHVDWFRFWNQFES